MKEGRKVGRALVELMDGKANIIELRGTEGSYPAIESGQGFREALQDYPEMKILASQEHGSSAPKARK